MRDITGEELRVRIVWGGAVNAFPEQAFITPRSSPPLAIRWATLAGRRVTHGLTGGDKYFMVIND